MHRGLVLCLLLTITSTSFCTAKNESDGGVLLVLTKSNFSTFVNDNEFVLVDFYAPWSGHSRELAVELTKAAKTLANQGYPIKLAKVDSTQETELNIKNDIRTYPTLILFRRGTAMGYKGVSSREADIIAWLLKKTGHPAKELKSVDEAKDFVNSSNVAVVGFFKDRTSDAAKEFLATAADLDDKPFGITSNDDVFKEYGAKNGSIIVFKKFDEGQVFFEGDVTEENIKKFVSLNSLPLVVEYDPYHTHNIMYGGGINNRLLLFLMRGEDHFEEITEAARSVAKPFREKIIFVRVDVSVQDNRRLLDFFAIKNEELPTSRITNVEGDIAKYKQPNNDLSAEAIRAFVQDFLDGKIKQQYLSQDLPADWDKEPVKILVGTNYYNVTLDPAKDVLVEFYASWCPHCTQLEPVLKRLAKYFTNDEDVIIAKIDGPKNELEHTRVVQLPTIFLYTKGEKKVIKYNGTRTFEGLKKFVESGGAEGASIDEETA